MVVLGYLYSRVELDYIPIYPPEDWRRDLLELGAWYFAPWPVWLIFGTLVASDVGTTLIGIRESGPGSWSVVAGIAQSLTWSAAAAVVVTFVPERLALWSWKRIRG
ncbi:MAG: hypothetical protein OHK0022_19350 [Roseiflexaceae bacterium]